MSTKKQPDNPTKTKVIPNAKGNDKKIQSLKEKIAKLQRELQSQFDTAAAVMRKFKETKKKHDDKKITQKTSNAEAQPENEKKKTKVSQKAEPTKNIEEKAPDKKSKRCQYFNERQQRYKNQIKIGRRFQNNILICSYWANCEFFPPHAIPSHTLLDRQTQICHYWWKLQ
ncbi:Hypothetical_protein [Hexamita inflata]|uniref:Hypothetical_protein n=1 Tax=Hexamita inflata TaxID=28002 RepID=A0AA86PEE9_9EUKA|nr:Hypothetical protein HINF_LOCUS24687 [Hexamita inflata]